MDENVIIDELLFDTATDHPSKEKKPLAPDKKFHIFFSYRDVPRDKLWVKNVIYKLEIEHGYTCCDHERDFLPGTKIMDNIKDSVKNSEKVVVVFSKEAIDSDYVVLEAEMAHRLSLEIRRNLLIPVLLDDCDVPEEFKLLTYIDAKKGVEETTWWPKLLKSIESRERNVCGSVLGRVVPTFAVSKIDSIETKYSCLRCRIQANSKYVPAELRPEAIGVPVDLIQATYKELLQSPRVVCRQKCCCFATICVIFWALVFAVLFFVSVVIIFYCMIPLGKENKTVCPLSVGFYIWFGLLIVSPVCCFFVCKKRYLKNPNSVHKKIIEHNRNLSKHGVMVTIVPGSMWEKASEYVICHLVKEESPGTIEHRDIPDSGQMVASNEDSLLLFGVGDHPHNREVDPSRQCARAVSQSYVNPSYMDIDDESQELETMFNAAEDTVQSIQNVAIDPVKSEEDEDVTDVADDEPLLPIQETENLDYENKALNLLLSCTPEYFALAYANKLKVPKEDRHAIEFMCLCQYLEKADKSFRGKVKRIQSLRRKRNIKDETNNHFENILLK